MTSPSPAERIVKDWWMGDRENRALADKDYDSLIRHITTAFTAAQQAQREADMAVVVKVLTDEIPGVDSLLERVLDALWRRDDE